MEILLQDQSWFIPHSIGDDGTYHNVPAGLPLPILVDELDDRVGHGSFSEVFKVEVDLEANLLG